MASHTEGMIEAIVIVAHITLTDTCHRDIYCCNIDQGAEVGARTGETCDTILVASQTVIRTGQAIEESGDSVETSWACFIAQIGLLVVIRCPKVAYPVPEIRDGKSDRIDIYCVRY